MPAPVALVETAYGDPLRCGGVYYHIVADVYRHMIDAAAPTTAREEHKITGTQFITADTPAIFGLFAARPRQFYAGTRLISHTGKSRAISTVATIAAIGIRHPQPRACSLDYGA